MIAMQRGTRLSERLGHNIIGRHGAQRSPFEQRFATEPRAVMSDQGAQRAVRFQGGARTGIALATIGTMSCRE